MRCSIIAGDRVRDGTGSFNTYFDPVTVLPYLVIPGPDFAPFVINSSSADLSLSTAMAPYSPISYETGPHQFILTVVFNDTSTDLLPPHAWNIYNITIDIEEVQ